jgi:hypothetical protein
MNPDAAAAIQRAFASGEFSKARTLWSVYAEQLRVAIAGPGAAAALAEAGQLVEWARLYGKCLRAHAGAQLSETRIATQYADRAPARHTRLQTLL